MAETMWDERDAVSVERVIAAPPEVLFAIIADPSRHADLDGSGTVQGSSWPPGTLLREGDEFGMRMRWGLPYSTSNVVTECEENRLIAWRTVFPAPLRPFAGGRTWRYRLEPVADGTLVRETWDISTEAALTRPGVRRMAALTRRNMAATLERLAELTEPAE